MTTYSDSSEPHGWPIVLPDVPHRRMLRSFLVEHFGRAFADRIDYLADVDRFSGLAVQQRVDRRPHIHWAEPSPGLRDRLREIGGSSLWHGWDSVLPAREVSPPVGRRVTPAQARQIREDVAEEFRGWAGL